MRTSQQSSCSSREAGTESPFSVLTLCRIRAFAWVRHFFRVSS
jgi:hypothetical protein